MKNNEANNIFIQNINKNITCCFTGHRPSKVGFSFSFCDEKFTAFRNKLEEEIDKSLLDGYKYFFSGGGLGFDLLAAEIVFEKLAKDSEIKLCFALPCLNHYKYWTKIDKDLFRNLSSISDEIVYVNEREYFTGCMHDRNRYLVNRSSRIIAGFNGSKGGTKYTIDYANKQGLDSVIIDLPC